MNGLINAVKSLVMLSDTFFGMHSMLLPEFTYSQIFCGVLLASCLFIIWHKLMGGD